MRAISDSANRILTSVGRTVLDPDYGTSLENPERDVVVLGTTAGAVVGAAVGTYLGFRAQDTNQVNEQWKTHSIDHPSLQGWSHHTSARYNEDCHTEGSGDNAHRVCDRELDGWWHRYSPNISERPVGSYRAPEFHNTKFMEPLLGGFLGAVGGGLLGLGIGVGVNALRHSLNHEQPEPAALSTKERDEMARTVGAVTLVGGGVGLLTGALLGHASGVMEQAQKQVQTREWLEPVYQRQSLGEIPRDYYQKRWFSIFPRSGEDYRNGTEPVYRDVPVYDANGRPALHSVKHTFDSARYGPLGGAILGGLIGGGVGLAAGVAAGTLLKIVDRPATKPS